MAWNIDERMMTVLQNTDCLKYFKCFTGVSRDQLDKLSMPLTSKLKNLFNTNNIPAAERDAAVEKIVLELIRSADYLTTAGENGNENEPRSGPSSPQINVVDDKTKQGSSEEVSQQNYNLRSQKRKQNSDGGNEESIASNEVEPVPQSGQTTGRLQQPCVFVSQNLRKIKMEEDYNVVKQEPTTEEEQGKEKNIVDLKLAARDRNDDVEQQQSAKSKRTRGHQSPSPSRSSSRANRKGITREKRPIESDDDNENEPRPGPSSEVNKTDGKTEQTTKSRPKKKQDAADVGGLEKIPEQYRPPQWLSEVMPKRSPYFPQLGDDLVYFRQGHENYVKHIESKPQKFYAFDNKMKKALPYVQNPDLPAEISVKVVEIKFELLPPRVVYLKLARTNWETGEMIGSYIFVQYHDVPSLVDFLVLRQIYDKSVGHRWNVGDRFRCLISTLYEPNWLDNHQKWWLGTVLAKEPHSPEFPDSNFLCYDIEWDVDHDHECLSPWDMEIITDDFEIPENHDNSQAIPASEEEIRNTLYEVKKEDWEPHGDAECQRISTLVSGVMDLPISVPFSTPVDLNMYPTYAFAIEYLIDLSTIKARLDNRFYRRAAAVETDIEHIASNTEKYNEPEAEIVKCAKIIRDLLLEIVNNQNFKNVNEAYHRIAERYEKTLKEQKPPIASSSNSSPSFTSKLGKEKTRGNDASDDGKTWEEKCRNLLESVWSKIDAAPFRNPVNILDYPDYNQVIDTPMCLYTVKEDLRGANYSSPQEFHRDMMLIFENSRQFNTEPRSPIRLMGVRLQNFYESNVKSILDSWKSKRNGTNANNNKNRINSKPVKSTTTTSKPSSLQTRSKITSSPNKNISSPRQKSNVTSSRPSSTRNGNISSISPTRSVCEAAAKNPCINSQPAHSFSTSSPNKRISSLPSSSSAVKEANQNGNTRNKRQRRMSSTSEDSVESYIRNSLHSLRKRRQRVVLSSDEESEDNHSSNHVSSSSNSKVPLLSSTRTKEGKADDDDDGEEEDDEPAPRRPGKNQRPTRDLPPRRKRSVQYNEDSDVSEDIPPTKAPGPSGSRATRNCGQPTKRFVESEGSGSE